MIKETRKSRSKFRKKLKIPPFVYLGGAFLLALAMILAMTVDFNPIGEKVDIMTPAAHVPIGTDPGPYNSNPPTSGEHYSEHFTSEFFNENKYEYPEGYLVHNLEHGYVIFWYNCANLDASACDQLKGQIQSVMDRVKMNKVIAYPWSKIDQPVVMTSWGRILRFDQFDTQLAYRFAKKYHNQAPEPQGE